MSSGIHNLKNGVFWTMSTIMKTLKKYYPLSSEIPWNSLSFFPQNTKVKRYDKVTYIKHFLWVTLEVAFKQIMYFTLSVKVVHLTSAELLGISFSAKKTTVNILLNWGLNQQLNKQTECLTRLLLHMTNR